MEINVPTKQMNNTFGPYFDGGEPGATGPTGPTGPSGGPPGPPGPTGPAGMSIGVVSGIFNCVAELFTQTIPIEGAGPNSVILLTYIQAGGGSVSQFFQSYSPNVGILTVGLGRSAFNGDTILWALTKP